MNRRHMTGTAAVAAILCVAGCERDISGLQPVPLDSNPVVFLDAFEGGLDFQAFQGSRLDAVSIDTNERYQGSASLKVTVPAPGSTTGGYAGGAFTTRPARDLSSYNALTFWAKAGKAAVLDVAGLGNDNTGTSKYEASQSAIALTTTWRKYVIPIPLPERLSAERGLFFFAEGPEGAASYDIWFDEIQFETVTIISNPRPSMTTRTAGGFVGATVTVEGTRTVFSVAGTDRTIGHQPGYFTFLSSNEDVAVVRNGSIQVVGGGTAMITALLGAVPVSGTVTLNTSAVPPTAAPAPTLPAGNVIALYSNSYAAVPVDTWSATWDQADVADLKIAGNDTKAYTNLVFAGIEFGNATIDASAMTHFHIDVWGTEGSVFKVKLVDFGEDGTFGGAPDHEHELTLDAASTPPYASGRWASLDIPLTAFTGLISRGHMAQIIIAGDGKTIFVDNIYFHR